MTTVTGSRELTYSAEAAGDHGFLRCDVVQRHIVRDGRTQFTIAVCNATDGDALADAFVPDLAGQRQRTIVQTVVGSQSDFSTSIVLDLVPPGVIPEVHVILTGSDIHFTLAVPPSPVRYADADDMPAASVAAQRPLALLAHTTRALALPVVTQVRTPRARAIELRPPAADSPPVAPIVLGFTAILAIASLFVFRPQIGELRFPQKPGPDAAVIVRYHATGLGKADYSVMAPDGATIAAGPLALGDASFAVQLPRASEAAAYLVRVRVSNPIVTVSAEDYLHVAAPVTVPTPRPARAALVLAPPQIRSLALDRATLASGDTLTVNYDVLATTGSIALLDPATQITYGREQLSDSGHATFVAPHTDAERYLAVVLTATRGTVTTQSRVGLTVTPLDPAPSDAETSADATGAPAANPAEMSATATAITAPVSVHSLQPIRVEIRGAGTGLALRFLDDTGNELARRTIRSGQSIAEFTAPQVRTAARYVFELTYPRGAGAETVIRAITILP